MRHPAIYPPHNRDGSRAAAHALQSLSMRVQSWSLVAALLVVLLACWAWIIALAHDMYGPMTGASAWMMTPHWDSTHLLLLWVMWAVMMTGMMLPSAAPTIVLAGGGRGGLMALGYVCVWAIFSVGATALQWLLMRLMIVTPMMEMSGPVASALLLAIAGIYQLTPLKHACLSTCQSPMAFLTRGWRSGTVGAFRMGVDHGVYCVGCCWALMVLLFAGGVMNLVVIAALTAFVAFEKLVPLGVWGPRVTGAALLAAAAWVAGSAG
jgi:predicted metal-binding membrane protein